MVTHRFSKKVSDPNLPSPMTPMSDLSLGDSGNSGNLRTETTTAATTSCTPSDQSVAEPTSSSSINSDVIIELTKTLTKAMAQHDLATFQ